jgi:hypothetical protein
MYRRAGLTAWAILALIGSPLAAQEKDQITINDVFGRFGYTTHRASTKICDMVMTLDRRAYIEAIPQLKAIQMLNPEYVTQTRVNREPTVLAMGFALQIVPLVVKDLFDGDSAVGNCTFRQMIQVQDVYGNDRTEVLFWFDFSRGLYTKINWDKFAPENLPKIAPKFSFGIETMKQIETERDAAGD